MTSSTQSSETPHIHTHDDDCENTDINHQIGIAKMVCEKNGERFTTLRAHIFELVVSHHGPVKAYDLLDQLSPEHGSPKPPTVYRSLDFLFKLGLIHRVEALNAYVACGHTHMGHVAEFFICESCSTVIERHANDHLECAPKGFDVSRSVIEHYGKCGACRD